VFSGFDATAVGSTEGEQLAASLSGGWNVSSDGWSFNPYLRSDYTTIDIDAFTEQGGSGLALQIDDQDIDSWTGTGAVQLSRVLDPGWAVVVPSLRAEFEHEFEDDPRAIRARFAADPTNSFIVTDDADDRDYFNLGAGIAFQWRGGTSLFLDYERIVGLSDLTSNSFDFGFRKEF
jgi:outer membrane autotransporter protein